MFNFFSKDSKKKKIIKRVIQDSNSLFALEDVFADQNLAKAVADKLGVSPTQKNQSLQSLESVVFLEAPNMGISSLDGIEFLNNLRYADFSGNQISKFPDYSKTENNLYKNVDKLVYLNLSDNPVLDSNKLFGLNANTNRKKFLDSFVDASSRIGLGDVQSQIFPDAQINPRMIQIAIERLMPKTVENREELINEVLLKYVVGKKVFYNQDVYNGEIILNDGRIEFNTNLSNPSYLDDTGKQIVGNMIEKILPESELYLIRALINKATSVSKDNLDLEKINRGLSINDIKNFYKQYPEKLSSDYIKTENGFRERNNYSALKSSNISSQEEALLASIADQTVKDEYNKFLEYREILDSYQREHPNLQRDILKTLNKANEFTSNFLRQYLSIQDNILLSNEQKKVLDEARESFSKYIDTFVSDARSYFDQEIFGLEVEMKYVDMLAEADRKFGTTS